MSGVVLADEAAMVTKTSDAAEAPYVWKSASCDLGEYSLTVLTKAATGNARLYFVFRGFAETVRMLEDKGSLPLEIKNTRSLGMTFTDREGATWAFQPKRNKATCQLTLKKQGNELKLWGKCEKLTPKSEEESFASTISITENEAIRCTL